MKPLVALAAAVVAIGLAAPAHAERDSAAATVQSAGYCDSGNGACNSWHKRYGDHGYFYTESSRYKRQLKRRLRRRHNAYPRRLPVSAIVFRVERRHGVRVSAIRYSAGAYSVWGHDHHGRSVKLVVGPGGRLLAFYYLT